MELGRYAHCLAPERSSQFIKQFENVVVRALQSCKRSESMARKRQNNKAWLLMPEANATVESAEASLADHPAVRAWRKLEPERAEPAGIEVLKYDKRDGRVYRLVGVGPGGTNVVAKRSHSEAAAIEHLVYQEILPHLAINALQCYASIADDDTRFSWLFLEDAGNGEYSSDLDEHRILAGLWLGAMNLSAQRLPLAARLPDRRPASYLGMLQLARSMTHEKLEHSAFSADDRRILKAIATHCDLLEMHWGRIEQFCTRMPRTLVHGDLSSWNARIRANHAGKAVLIMDWEYAGWGVPAADLAQFAGNALTPDITAYWSVVQTCWPRLHLTDFRQLGELGRVFRWIKAVTWANWGFHEGAVEWYITEMKFYEPKVAEWAQGTESIFKLE
jgi:Ser/Thr protein kinase RdoA (MazF antagonist)